MSSRRGVVTRFLALAVMAMLLWPHPADAAAWYSTGWRYRKPITIHFGQVPNTDQVNFPVLINLASDTGLAAHAQTTGNDILFTSSDGITKIPYERERYTSGTGALVAWVKVPTLSHTADTVLYMYYGNSGAADQQDRNNTWDSNFKLVYHLGDAGPTTAADSTANGNNGTQSGGVTFGSTGQIDKATTYANSGSLNESISAASQPLGGGPYSGSFTYHLWIKVTGSVSLASSTADAGGSYFVDRTAAQAGNPLVSLIAVTGSHWGYQTRYDDGTGLGGPSGGTLTSGGSAAWTHIEMVRDVTNNLFRLYVNGTSVGTTASDSSRSLTPSTPKLGRHASFGSPSWLNGLIDEFRVSSVARSADWIKTEFNNQSAPGTFYGVGSEELVRRIQIL